tara:strand:+ start:23 stop:385 length:363 start_codon:yes stop_codon:yes gene_type:complete
MKNLTTIYEEVSKLSQRHIGELQDAIGEKSGNKPTKASLRRILLSLGSGTLEATFNTREAAHQVERSEAWVKKISKKYEVGRIRRTAGSGQLEFTLDEVDELQSHVKNTRRGRPVIKKYR